MFMVLAHPLEERSGVQRVTPIRTKYSPRDGVSRMISTNERQSNEK